jgi:hypothetical protein
MAAISRHSFNNRTQWENYLKVFSSETSQPWENYLKVYYPRTIHAMFALNWLTGFRGEDF